MNLIAHTVVSLVIFATQHGHLTNSQAVQIVRLFYRGQWG